MLGNNNYSQHEKNAKCLELTRVHEFADSSHSYLGAWWSYVNRDGSPKNEKSRTKITIGDVEGYKRACDPRCGVTWYTDKGLESIRGQGK